MEVSYPEEQMLIVADFTISRPRKEFAFTPIKAEVFEGPIMSFFIDLFICSTK